MGFCSFQDYTDLSFICILSTGEFRGLLAATRSAAGLAAFRSPWTFGSILFWRFGESTTETAPLPFGHLPSKLGRHRLLDNADPLTPKGCIPEESRGDRKASGRACRRGIFLCRPSLLGRCRAATEGPSFERKRIQQRYAPEGPGRSESPGRARRREIFLLNEKPARLPDGKWEARAGFLLGLLFVSQLPDACGGVLKDCG